MTWKPASVRRWLAERERRRRHRKAEEVRQKVFGGPPLAEWERDAMYGAVEAERKQQG